MIELRGFIETVWLMMNNNSETVLLMNETVLLMTPKSLLLLDHPMQPGTPGQTLKMSSKRMKMR